MTTIIKNATVVDPGHLSARHDIVVQNGMIAVIAEPGSDLSYFVGSAKKAPMVIDARGLVVVPGLIDIHVHLREPGFEYKETIASGCNAAAWGGFTAVCPMPNTNPINDNAQVTELILQRASRANGVRVLPVAAISKGSTGHELADFEALKKAGAVALSDDGWPVVSGLMMRRAMEAAKQLEMVVISHCEDAELAEGGCINEGPVSDRLGVQGIPNAAESIMAMRDIALCELTGAALHLAHISTRQTVAAVRAAKTAGLNVTAETAPHYFTLTDEAVADSGGNAKMNPPLRAQADMLAIQEGLSDGTIDIIATDHAPHSIDEKNVALDQAANGIIGLETALGLGLQLVAKGVLDLESLIEKMSICPAQRLGLPTGIRVGNPADLTILDLDKIWRVDANLFKSLSRNSPFNGYELRGKAVMTMVAGHTVFSELTTQSGPE